MCYTRNIDLKVLNKTLSSQNTRAFTLMVLVAHDLITQYELTQDAVLFLTNIMLYCFQMNILAAVKQVTLDQRHLIHSNELNQAFE